MNTTFRNLSISALSTLIFVNTCFAQQDPEAAARQARIDAAQADVKINQAQRRIEEAADMDGVDATTIIGDQEEINQEGERKIEAIRKEREAEGKN